MKHHGQIWSNSGLKLLSALKLLFMHSLHVHLIHRTTSLDSFPSRHWISRLCKMNHQSSSVSIAHPKLHVVPEDPLFLVLLGVHVISLCLLHQLLLGFATESGGALDQHLLHFCCFSSSCVLSRTRIDIKTSKNS